VAPQPDKRPAGRQMELRSSLVTDNGQFTETVKEMEEEDDNEVGMFSSVNNIKTMKKPAMIS
jgi:hypothetical protein